MPFDGFALLSSRPLAKDSRQVRRAKGRGRVPKPVVVDSETFAAEDRPWGPAVPTLWAIKYPGKGAKYYAYGHASGNNCTWAEAREALLEAWAWPDGVVFHNCKYDLAGAYEHMDLPELPPERCHDTMFLAYLDDPNQREIGLKPLGVRLLGMDPGERDAVADWLVKNQPVPGVKISASTSSQAKHPFMAYLPFAPGDVVGSYALGDVERTAGLFEILYRSVVLERGMGDAYDRERRLVPVLMENERHGLRVDLPRLRDDVAKYRAEKDRVDDWLRRRLGAPPDFDLEKKAQVIARVFEAGLGDPLTWPQTEKSTAERTTYATREEAFRDHCADPAFAALWAYRLKLSTCLATFMENWLRTAEASGGYIFTDWHQTRGAEGGGARTGRLSSSPNFQNLVKSFEPLFYHEGESQAPTKVEISAAKDPVKKLELQNERARLLALPRCPIKDLLPLPLVRKYIAPFEPGHVLLDRDFSQQEPRILAHFEGGLMKRQYLANPWMDFHDNAKENLERVMHRPYKRKMVKTVNLGIIYGQGISSLAERNGSTVAETKEIREGILQIYPGLKEMGRRMKLLAAAGQPLETWGGRLCLCEEPAIINGRVQTFEYKMINTLIQSSAADCTKEVMIRFYVRKKPTWYLYLNVHDELVTSVPAADREEAMEILRDCMESVEFDVPMLSEGEWSPTSWGDLETYDKKGKRVAA